MGGERHYQLHTNARTISRFMHNVSASIASYVVNEVYTLSSPEHLTRFIKRSCCEQCIASQKYGTRNEAICFGLWSLVDFLGEILAPTLGKSCERIFKK